VRVEETPPLLGRTAARRPGVYRAAAVAALAWLALTFLLRDPLHYLVDPSPESFGRFWPNRPWLLAHVLGGTAALLLGPLQFSVRLRARRPALHRWMGRGYLAGVLLAAVPSFYLAFFAEEASFGAALLVLAVVWLATSGRALLAIRRGDRARHREWMIRSYLVTFAFVTFRFLGILPVWGVFGAHREAVAGTLAWLLPLLVAERGFRRRRPAGVSAPPQVVGKGSSKGAGIS
jgi:uncharacterized membrane protein